MGKKTFLPIVMIAILMLSLAACTSTGTSSTSEAGAAGGEPVEGAAQPGADVTQPTASGSTAGSCVDVDTAQLMTAGEAFYSQNCADCHGAQGEGQGDFPALAANGNVTGTDVLALIQGYFAVDAHPKDISQQDLAAVLTYVRGSFGNASTPVCPGDIQIPATQ